MTAVEDVARALRDRADRLPPALAHRRAFIDTYRRTTVAVGQAVAEGRFEDPDWVAAWDVAFAELFLAAHDADRSAATVPRPWRLAFTAAPELPALRHVLLGINAHINFDLPQALLAVIRDEQFGDGLLLDRRRRDHERIDGVLAGRIAAEDHTLDAGKTWLDRALTPLNRLSSKRFLREARQKVWHNTIELHQARVAGTSAFTTRLAELEVLAAARIADLLAPGPVLMRLAVAGFGVSLPPPL